MAARVGPRRLERLAAVLAGFALLLTALATGEDASVAAKPQRAPQPPREFFGVVPGAPIFDDDLVQMGESGIGTLRYMFFWPAIEQSPGTYTWDAHDDLMREATANGIRVFPTLFGTPDWANSLAGRDACGSICAPHANVTREAFARFAKAVAERYGPGGDFWSGSEGAGECSTLEPCPLEPPPCSCTNPMPIGSYQIWNEQNSSKYFGPRPSPGAYARLVAEAAAALRAADPDAEVVLGGMWGPPKTRSVTPTLDYLKRLYAIAGTRASFDSVAVHPYAPRLAGVRDQLRRVRGLVRRADDAGVGIWVTELGWASGGPKNEGLVKTPGAQAHLLKKSFRYLISRHRAWRIRGVTWYAWNDAGPGESDCNWCPQAGLRDRDGIEKPAGRAFRELATR